MNRDGVGRGARHAVDVRGTEGERAARAVARPPLRLRDQQRVLLQHALDDVDGAARRVVVVPPRVVRRPPEQRPHVDVVVAVQRGVRALHRARVPVVAPQLRPCGDPRDQRAQLVALERPAGRHVEILDHAVTSWGTLANRRAGLATRSPCRAASLPRRGRRGLGVRAVRAVADDVDAEHADDGVDRLRAVARGLHEGERVHRERAAAAGAPALAVQRPQPGERDEADGQPRVARAALVDPRPPGRVQLGDVGDDRPPPRRPVAGRVGDAGRARMDEQRAPRLLEHAEQRLERGEAAGRREQVGAELQPDRPAAERIAQRAPGPRRHRPGAERRRKLQRALEPRLRQLSDSAGASRSSPSPADGRHADQLVSVRRGHGRAQRRTRGRPDRSRRPLAGQLQRPALHPRRGAPGAQRRQEGRGPQVLVEVGLHCWKRITESIH